MNSKLKHIYLLRQFAKKGVLFLSLIAIVCPALAEPRSYVFRGDQPMYTEFRDPDFPFMEATVDLRNVGPSRNEENIVPRALVISLPEGVQVCFDTELLRVAAIWQGEFLTPSSMAMNSYTNPLEKVQPGQASLPSPLGEVMSATGLYPGWHPSGEESFQDPRSRWDDPREVGRGPLPAAVGEWEGVFDAGDLAILSYSLYGGKARERYSLEQIEGNLFVRRDIALVGIGQPLALVLDDLSESERKAEAFSASAGEIVLKDERHLLLKISPTKENRTISVRYALGDYPAERPGRLNVPLSTSKTEARWSESARTSFALGEAQGSYAVDELEIPYPNPWQRRIRPVGIDFFPNGDAVVVTYDGDVYRVIGMGRTDSRVTLTRIAAGFNEPQSVRIRGEHIFVFSRLGVSQLIDTDGDGEIDFYRMFCNRFTQSADTRDFPLSLELRPGGSFLISKGGQQPYAPLPHSGRIMEISPDGEAVSFFAYGLRNGYLNVHPETGLITSADQQGNWVPSTPLHVVRRGSFLGYQPGAPKEAAPIQEPVLWLPHLVSPSGLGQVWGTDPRMGALFGSLLYIDYKRPAVIKIMMASREPVVRASAVSLPIEFEVPLLKGGVNPSDGQAYFVGFQIWDSIAPRLEGISRLRTIQETDTLPTQAQAFSDGILLTFSHPIDPDQARDATNYRVRSWEYHRTEQYGSPQLKADGEPGADEWFVHAPLVSSDGKSVFLAIKDLHRTMQLVAEYALFGSSTSVYFTIDTLFAFRGSDHGFDTDDTAPIFASEPSSRTRNDEPKTVVSAERGQALSLQYGCIGCHSVDGSTEGKSGPTWYGLHQSKRELIDGNTVVADREYLEQSILSPSASVPVGFDGVDAAMPSYKGILGPEEIDSLILYMESLD